MSNISILKFNPYFKGPLRGFFDIQMTKIGVEISGCTLMRKGNNYWVNLPSREWTDSQGEVKYHPVFKFIEDAHNKALKSKLLEMVLQYCEENNIDPENPNRDKPEPPSQGRGPMDEEDDLPF